MRQLATIQKIKTIQPIPEKDRIVLVTFEKVDWKVISGKDDFKVGDLAIYFEVDSLLPPEPCYEFLRKRCWNEKWQGHRIRNMKLGSIYSEGLVLPFSAISYDFSKYKEGDDVTDLLKIKKYDKEAREEAALLERNKKKYGPIMLFLLRIPFIKKILFPKKKRRGDFPPWAHESDETRVQVLPYVYETYKGVNVYVTEKMDGQSSLFGMVGNKFTVCSRHINLSMPSRMKGKYITEKSKYWETAEKFNIESKLRKASKQLGIDLYVQGEQCGPTIQDNKYAFPDLRFFVFNVYDVTHKKYFSFNEMLEFCSIYGFEMVPFIGITKFNWVNVDAMIEFSMGHSYYNTNIPREGVVIRSWEPMPPGRGMSNMMSFKVINPNFDLMYNKKE